MGCFSSRPSKVVKGKETSTAFKTPQWKSDTVWDERELQRKREEFWDTQPAYGGAKEIWDTLKAVTSDPHDPNNKLILESAGIIVNDNDLRTTYDERGFKYELPNFVLSEPSNLSKKRQAESPTSTSVHAVPAQSLPPLTRPVNTAANA